MRAAVNLPFHCHRQHLAADECEKISGHVKIETGESKRRVGIMRRESNGRNNRWRFVVIHTKIRAETRSREASVATVCGKRLGIRYSARACMTNVHTCTNDDAA